MGGGVRGNGLGGGRPLGDRRGPGGGFAVGDRRGPGGGGDGPGIGGGAGIRGRRPFKNGAGKQRPAGFNNRRKAPTLRVIN